MGELRLELPYEFDQADYEQILHDARYLIAPELGWRPVPQVPQPSSEAALRQQALWSIRTRCAAAGRGSSPPTWRGQPGLHAVRPLRGRPPDRGRHLEYRDSPPENFFTPFMGSAQRLPNGNTLVTESAFGRIFEVTRDGRVCWEYVVPYFSPYRDGEAARLFPDATNAIFRAYRYTPVRSPGCANKG